LRANSRALKKFGIGDSETSMLKLHKLLTLIFALAMGSFVVAQAPSHSAKKPARGATAASASRERSRVAAFRAKVEKILGAPDVNRGYWGMLVEDADNGEVLYSLNADSYFLPASNAKLFTAALTLATLGSDYCFHTTIESRATTNNDGVLAGDLVLVGRGDTNLSNRIFPFAKKTERDGPPEKVLVELADQVVARGVKKITGDVIGDDSYFAGGAYPSGWAIDDMLWSYGVPVSALEINDGVFFLELNAADGAGASATFTIAPSTNVYQIRNEVVTGEKGSPQKISVEREPGSTLVIVSGSMPVSAQPHSIAIAIDRPAEYAAALLKILLEARGVTVEGRARARHTGDDGYYSSQLQRNWPGDTNCQ
jgi:D-alanyl-D-alanine carboxypeptidase/D-alanyl-D-alanine-endopeptidase (penicillin-binding protein 4)